MKKLGIWLFCVLCAALAFNSAALGARVVVGDGSDLNVSVLESSSQRIALEFTLGAFDKSDVVIDGRTYSRISVPGEAVTLEKGLPELPLIARSVIIPDNRQMRLRVVSAETADIAGIDVVPSKGDLLRTVNPDDVPFAFDALYSGGAWYPQSPAFAREPYILRDYRGVTVVAEPFSYQPATHTLRVITRLVVELVDSGPGGPNTLNRTEAPGRFTPEFAEIYQTHFINYNEQPRYTMVPETGSMLIICYDAFMPNMQAFVDWKNQMGLPTTMVPVSQIGTTSSQIKTYIQNAYNASSNPKLAFVLLVGDAAQIPTPSSDGGAADPTYAKVVGTDYYPDILVGRFSAENAGQVDTQVLRSVTYEKNPLLAGSDWYPKGTGIASNQGPGDDGEYDYQHIGNIRTKLLTYGYTQVDEIYDPQATISMVSNALNQGRTIVNYCGHGSMTSWGTTGFSNSNVSALTNDWKLPFIFSVACVNGQFNAGTCFAEAWLRSTHNGNPIGAIGTYMSSINQSWNPPMCAEDECDRLLTQDLARTFGSLCFNGSCQMMDEYGSGGASQFNTWHVFGDPSLRVRTKPPLTMDPSAPATIAPDATTFEVDVPGAGRDALCGLSYQGQYLGSGFTNTNGHAVILVTGTLPEGHNIDLTVTAYNRVPWFGQVMVQPLIVPVIACNPDSFEVTIGVDAVLADTLVITNVGPAGSVLTYNAHFTSGVIFPWVGLQPAQGSLAAGESVVITVTFNSASMRQGNYNGNIVVDYNPSQQYTIPVLMHVSDETAVAGRDLPATAVLDMAGANPSSTSSRLHFYLPSGQSARLAVYDAAGRLVRVLREGPASSGDHVVTWDGRDAAGRAAGPGVYFTRLSTAEGDLTLRVLRVQ